MARKIYDLNAVLTGLAEAYKNPESPQGFRHDTFSHVAARIKDPEGGIDRNDHLVLLGKRDDVVHAIVARGDQIKADRQIDILGIDSTYSARQRQYTTKLTAGDNRQYVLNVVSDMSVQEFLYRNGIERRDTYDHPVILRADY